MKFTLKEGASFCALILVVCLIGCNKKENEEPTLQDRSFSVKEDASLNTLIGMLVGDDEEDDPLTYSLVDETY